MFDQLSDRLQGTLSDLRSRGKLSEADVDKAMREIRLALLEADVNFKVTKQFVADVREQAIGAGVLESLDPGQMVVKVVNEQLTELMGGSGRELVFASKGADRDPDGGPAGIRQDDGDREARPAPARARSKTVGVAACDTQRPRRSSSSTGSPSRRARRSTRRARIATPSRSPSGRSGRRGRRASTC